MSQGEKVIFQKEVKELLKKKKKKKKKRTGQRVSE